MSNIKVVVDPARGLYQKKGDASFSVTPGVSVDLGTNVVYAPVDPTSWSTVPDNLIQAIDYLAAGSGSSGGGSGPGGSNGQFQFRNGPNFAGSANLTSTGGNVFVTGSFQGSLNGTSSLALDLQEKYKLVSTLTYDPTIAASIGATFNSWDALWTAYQQTSGSVTIAFKQGLVLPTTQPTYSFRSNAKLKGLFGTYGSPTLLTFPSGTSFENILEFDAVKIESLAPHPIIKFNDLNPSIFADNGTSFIANGTSPIIVWDHPTGTDQLSIDFQHYSGFLSGTSPVLAVTGADFSQATLVLGQKCFVESGTLGGSGSNIVVEVRDGTTNFDFGQPDFLGTINGSSFTAATTFDLNFPNVILSTVQSHTEQLNIFSPDIAFAPVGIFQGFSTTTADATPTAFSQLAIPPVISAILESYIVARDVGSSDTAVWKVKGMIIGDGSGAYSGSLGLNPDFHDYTAGASTWDVSSSFNIPTSGDVKFYGIGEVGKTINWALYQTVTIVLGI